MDCPHLSSVKIVTCKNENLPDWLCSSCKTKKSPWMCTYCGIVNCGRYVNGHAKAHFEAEPQHSVCLDCESYAAFCYICNEYVTNDNKTNNLQQLRDSLQSLSSTTQVELSPKKRHNNSGANVENQGKKKKLTKKSKDYCRAQVSGLRNLGNTCFMNAVLQSLSNIQQFCCYFKQLPTLEAKPEKNGKKNHTKREESNDLLLVEEVRKILVSMSQGSKTAISPESLFNVVWKVVPRFRGYQQQDAHEFLRYMLDRLHTELLNILPYPAANSSLLISPKGKSTIVTTIFGGVLQNEVKCLVCGTESKKHDPFLDLSLDIPHHFLTKPSRAKNDDSSSLPSCHILDCLTSFTELEELADSELYHCHSCKEKQRSTKKFWIRRLPNVLCLHLKRFRWNNFFRVKIDNFIEFPIQGLDMSKFLLGNMVGTRGNTSGSTLYDLAAIIVHHGSGAGSGHYTAYATHEGCWHHFNDSSVTQCDVKTVAQSKAYILFYIRRELNLVPFNL